MLGDGQLYRKGHPLAGPRRGEPGASRLTAQWLVETLAVTNFISTATAVVRTSVQKALGPYRGELPHAGDLEMWLRYTLHSQVAYISAHQAAYRSHEANMSLGYDDAADLAQCASAFDLHYPAIRERLPDGVRLEAAIREHFAERSRTLTNAGHVAG